jgi:hypothetical protein
MSRLLDHYERTFSAMELKSKAWPDYPAVLDRVTPAFAEDFAAMFVADAWTSEEGPCSNIVDVVNGLQEGEEKPEPVLRRMWAKLKNLNDALAMGSTDEALTTERIQLIHAAVAKDFNGYAGKYRTRRALTGCHAPAASIETRMDALLVFYDKTLDCNKTIQHVIKLAAFVFQQLMAIQPFISDNEAVARIVVHSILKTELHLPVLLGPTPFGGDCTELFEAFCRTTKQVEWLSLA